MIYTLLDLFYTLADQLFNFFGDIIKGDSPVSSVIILFIIIVLLDKIKGNHNY